MSYVLQCIRASAHFFYIEIASGYVQLLRFVIYMAVPAALLFSAQTHGGSFVDKGAWITSSYGAWANYANRIHYVDVNGDGLQDIILGPDGNGKWFVAQSTGSSFVDKGAWIPASPYSAWASSPTRINYVDVSGDGLQDIILGPDGNGKWFVLQSTGSGFVDKGAWITTSPYSVWSNYGDRVNFADVNGDGLQDIVLGPDANGKWSVVQSTGSSFVDKGAWITTSSYGNWADYTNRIHFVDVNGEGSGLRDIVIGPNASGKWSVVQSTGSSFVDKGAWITTSPYSTWENSTDRIRFVDVNGDGLPDIILGPDANGKWFVVQSTGNSFVDKGAWIPASPYGAWASSASRINYVDVNGDGLQDIILGPDGSGRWFVMLSTGSGFIDKGATWMTSSPYSVWANYSDRINFADVDGDGLPDIVIGPDSSGKWFVVQTVR